MLLNSDYNGVNKSGQEFVVFGDFTPNYGWPLVVPNSFSMHSIVNQIIVAQDRKIKELEDRIKNLESK